jgi:hypothetical protein
MYGCILDAAGQVLVRMLDTVDRRLALNHSFLEGNKRVAHAAMEVFSEPQRPRTRGGYR